MATCRHLGTEARGDLQPRRIIHGRIDAKAGGRRCIDVDSRLCALAAALWAYIAAILV
jgi:hypothetical protein